MSEWNFIVAAYTVTWVAILGYGVHLSRRLARAAQRLRNAEETSASENDLA